MDTVLLMQHVKENADINEIYGSYTYTIPKDKENVLYDFYMMSALPEPTDPDLKYALDDAKTQLYDHLQKVLPNALSFAVAAEFRHIFDNNNSESIINFFKKLGAEDFIKKYARYYKAVNSNSTIKDYLDVPKLRRSFKNDSRGYKDSYEAVKSTGIPTAEFMKLAGKAFRQLNWSSAYGGEKWGAITDGWTMLKNAKTQGEKIVAIDHVYDLQHNTDTVFNKLKSYYKDGYGWLKKALDHKAHIKDVYELMDKVSAGLKKFGAAVIKNAKGTTLEDYYNDKDGKEVTDRFKALGITADDIMSVSQKDYKVGDKVKVTSGKYAGMGGIIAKDTSTTPGHEMVDILGITHNVSIPISDLEKVTYPTVTDKTPGADGSMLYKDLYAKVVKGLFEDTVGKIVTVNKAIDEDEVTTVTMKLQLNKKQLQDYSEDLKNGYYADIAAANVTSLYVKEGDILTISQFTWKKITEDTIADIEIGDYVQFTGTDGGLTIGIVSSIDSDKIWSSTWTRAKGGSVTITSSNKATYLELDSFNKNTFKTAKSTANKKAVATPYDNVAINSLAVGDIITAGRDKAKYTVVDIVNQSGPAGDTVVLESPNGDKHEFTIKELQSMGTKLTVTKSTANKKGAAKVENEQLVNLAVGDTILVGNLADKPAKYTVSDIKHVPISKDELEFKYVLKNPAGTELEFSMGDLQGLAKNNKVTVIKGTGEELYDKDIFGLAVGDVILSGKHKAKYTVVDIIDNDDPESGYEFVFRSPTGTKHKFTTKELLDMNHNNSIEVVKKAGKPATTAATDTKMGFKIGDIVTVGGKEQAEIADIFKSANIWKAKLQAKDTKEDLGVYYLTSLTKVAKEQKPEFTVGDEVLSPSGSIAHIISYDKDTDNYGYTVDAKSMHKFTIAAKELEKITVPKGFALGDKAYTINGEEVTILAIQAAGGDLTNIDKWTALVSKAGSNYTFTKKLTELTPTHAAKVVDADAEAGDVLFELGDTVQLTSGVTGILKDYDPATNTYEIVVNDSDEVSYASIENIIGKVKIPGGFKVGDKVYLNTTPVTIRQIVMPVKPESHVAPYAYIYSPPDHVISTVPLSSLTDDPNVIEGVTFDSIYSEVKELVLI